MKNYFTGFCRYSFMLIIFFLSGNKFSYAQLNLSSGIGAQQLAQILAGQGVQITNATLNCPDGASGAFTGGSGTNMGINQGIILTSGSINIAQGPNSSGSAGAGSGSGGDSDLDNLTNGATEDACVLEFDITPMCDTLLFRYVFGSEEYPEFVGSSFNDVFGFFISGSGITGVKNIALIPGSTVNPVAINSVNAGSNSQYYIDNNGGATIEYDAFTIVLTAFVKVQKCSTYHIKLAIADVGDSAYDSGVFLEQGTLSCNIYEANATVSMGVEGCQDAEIEFCKLENFTSATQVDYTISGTASNGIDYSAIPLSFIIPASQVCTTLVIHPLTDGLIEGGETVTLTYKPGQCAAMQTVTVSIYDSLNVNAGPNVSICSGGSANIGAPTINGVTYSWSPTLGLSNPSIANPTVTLTNTSNAPITQAYVLSGSSVFGCGKSDTVVVTVNPLPSVSFSVSPIICVGENDTITFTGSAANGAVFNWNFGGGTVVSGTGQGPYIVNWGTAGVINVTLSVSLSGCTSPVISVPVTIVGAPSVSVSPANPILCKGDSITLTASGATNYTWTPSAGLSSGTGSSVIAFPDVTTTYTVTGGTNGGSCSGTKTIQVIVNDSLPTVTVSPNSIVNCQGGSVDLTGTVKAHGNVSTNPVVTFNSSGAVAIPDGDFTGVNSNIAVSGVIPATPVNIDKVCIDITHTWDSDLDIYLVCPGGTQIELSTSNGGSSDNYTNTCFTPTATNPITLGSAPFTGNYIPEQSFNLLSGCIANGNWSLKVVDDVSSDQGTINNWSISFVNNASIPNTIASYFWTPATGLSDPNSLTPTVNVQSSQTYILTAVDANGCEDTARVNVILDSLNLSITNDTNICSGQSVQLQASGGDFYSWSPSVGLTDANIANPVATPLVTTTYVLNATGLNGCTGIDSVTIYVDEWLKAGNDTTICLGDTIQLNASGGNSYSWIPATEISNTNIANPYVYPSVNTDYIVSANNGTCSLKDTIGISVIQLSVLNVSDDATICLGESVTLTASGGINYQWSPLTDVINQNNGSITVMPSQNIIYYITAEGVCDGNLLSDSIEVTVINIDTSFTVSGDPCFNTNSFDFLAISANSPGTVYFWDFGTNAMPQSANGDNASGVSFNNVGFHNITLSIFYNGCSKTASRQIEVFRNPDPLIGVATQTCGTMDVTFENLSSNATGYQWSFGDGNSDNSETPLHTYDTDGIYDVTLIASDANCEDSVSTTILVNPLLATYFDAPATQCFVASGNSFDFAVAGTFTPAATFNWDFGTNALPASSTLQNPLGIVFTGPGAFDVTLSVTENGCTDDFKDVVVIDAETEAVIDPQSEFCNGFTVNFSNSSTNAATYSWNFGDLTSLSDTSAISSPAYTYPDSGKYTVTLLAVNGACSDLDMVDFYVYPLLDPSISLLSPDTQCILNNNFNFDAIGSFSSNAVFDWYFGTNSNPSNSFLQSVNFVSYSSTGTSSVVLSVSENGCNASDTVNVVLLKMPEAIFDLDAGVGCVPLSITFTDKSISDTPLDYLWNFGDGETSVQASPSHIYDSVGTFTVSLIVAANNGCIFTDTIFSTSPVEVYSWPTAGYQISPMETTILEPAITFSDPLNTDSCQWDFGNGQFSDLCDVVYSYTDTGTYQVVHYVYNKGGCMDSIVATIVIKPEYAFWIPNAFTPNGDSLNEVFIPKILGVGEDNYNYNFLIYDRWGQLIWSANKLNDGWDGTLEGGTIKAQMDIYVYRITFTNDFGEEKKFMGHFTLLR